MEEVKKYLQEINWNESVQFETGISEIEISLPDNIIETIVNFIEAITDPENQPNQFGIEI